MVCTIRIVLHCHALAANRLAKAHILTRAVYALGLALQVAECESANKSIANTYSLQLMTGKGRANSFQAQLMALAWAPAWPCGRRLPHMGCLSMDPLENRD